MGRKSKNNSAQKPVAPRTKLQVQQLEDRSVPAVISTLQQDGTLNITFDANQDTAVISQIGSQLQVQHGSQTDRFDLERIQHINAQSIRGEDQIITLNGGFTIAGNLLVNDLDSVVVQNGAYQFGDVDVNADESVLVTRSELTSRDGITLNAENMVSSSTSILGVNVQGQTQVVVDASALDAQTITLFANTIANGNAEGDLQQDTNRDFSRIVVNADSLVSVTNRSRLNATRNIVIQAKTTDTTSATAEAKSSSTTATVDAAVASANVTTSAIAQVDEQSSLMAGGNVVIESESVSNITSIADGSLGGANAKGGSIALATINGTTQTTVNNGVVIQANTIDILAKSTTAVNTSAQSTQGGATSNDSSTQAQLTDSGAATSEGTLGIAGAFAYNKVTNRQTNASVNSSQLTATGNLNIRSESTTDITSIADGSITGSSNTVPALGFGIGIGVNRGSIFNTAFLGGNNVIDANNVNVVANTPQSSDFKAQAISGAGASNVGFAGAAAINDINQTSQAFIGGETSQNLNGSNLSLLASNTTTNIAEAKAQQVGSTGKVGIGASFALNSPNHNTEALIGSGSNLQNFGNLSLDAVANHVNTTNVVIGAAGGLAVTPGAALSLINNNTDAILSTSSRLQVSGNVSLNATQNSTTQTNSQGDALSNSVGIGTAVALSDVNDLVTTKIQGNVSASGSVTLNSTLNSTSAANAVAGAKGTSTTQTANQQIDQQKPNLDRPSAETSDGVLSGAAALGLNLVEAKSVALIDAGTQLTAGKAINIQAINQSNTTAKGDSSKVGDGVSPATVGVGIGLAINQADVVTDASIGAGATVSGTSLVLHAKNPSNEDPHIFLAEATSGAGSKKVGVAGSFALNLVDTLTQAIVNQNATVNTGNGSILLNTENRSVTTTKATPKNFTTGEIVGVGASVALTFVDHETHSEVEDLAKVQGGATTIQATSDHDANTEAKGGAGAQNSNNSIAVTPVVAISDVDNQTSARLGRNALNPSQVSGKLVIDATHDGDLTTTAQGNSQAQEVAVGVSVALNLGTDVVSATLGTVQASGGIDISAEAEGNRQALAKASNKGGETTNQTVNERITQLKDFANGLAGNPPPSPPPAQTAEGLITFVGSLAVNTHQELVLASIERNGIVSAGGKINIESLQNIDTSANASADAVGAKGTSGLGFGGAVALNKAILDNEASINSFSNVQSQGLSLHSGTTDELLLQIPISGRSVAQADATSGAGKNNIGIAGAFALSQVEQTTTAIIRSGAVIDAGNRTEEDDVTLSAETRTTSDADSKPVVTNFAGQAAVGIGASVSLATTNNLTTASIASNVNIVDADDVLVESDSSEIVNAKSETGADGGVAITPSAAIGIDQSRTTANIQSGSPLSLSGKLLVEAEQTSKVTTTAKGDAAGNDVAIGLSAAISIQEAQTTTEVDRNITSGESLTVRSISDFNSTADSKASALGEALGAQATQSTAQTAGEYAKGFVDRFQNRGKKEEDGDDNLTLSQKIENLYNTGKTKANEYAEKNLQNFGAAAAFGLNLTDNLTQAQVAANRVLIAGGEITVETQQNSDATAKALGLTVGEDSLGAAVAINLEDFDNVVKIDPNVQLQGSNIILRTGLIPDLTNNSHDSSAFAVSAAGGKDSSFVGSAALNFLDATTAVSTGTGVRLQSTLDLIIQADQELGLQAVAGGAAGGLQAGRGASVALNAVDSDTSALVGNSNILTALRDIQVEANTTIGSIEGLAVDPSSVATGGAVTVDNNIIGSASVNLIDDNTTARIGEFATITQNELPAFGEPTLKVHANDDVTLRSFGGAISFSESKGRNFSVDLNVLNRTTEASILRNASIVTDGTIDVRANATENVLSVSGSAGLSGQGAIAGSVSIYLPDLTTRAHIGSNAVISSNGTSVVADHDAQNIDLVAGTLNGSLNSNSFGGSFVVVDGSDTVEAFVGHSLQMQSTGSGLTIRALNQQDIAPKAIGGSGAGGSAIVGSGTFTKLIHSTFAYLEKDGFLDLTPPNGDNPSVTVEATDNTQLFNLSGATAVVGSTGFGAGFDGSVLNKSTLAWIAEGNTISASGDVNVRATSDEDITSVVGGIGVAGGSSIFGTLALQKLNVTTRAILGDDPRSNQPLSQNAANIFAEGNVIVTATDTTEIDAITGNGGVTSGTSVGASAAIPLISKTTEAIIANGAFVTGLGNKQAVPLDSGGFNIGFNPNTNTYGEVKLTDLPSYDITGDGVNDVNDLGFSKDRFANPIQTAFRGVGVTATSTDDIEALTFGVSVAGGVAVNINAPVTVANSTVRAIMGGDAQINTSAVPGNNLQGVRVVANNDQHVFGLTGVAGVTGGATILPAGNVAVVKQITEALVGQNADVRAKDDVEITADATQDVLAVTVGAGFSGAVNGIAAATVLTFDSDTKAAILSGADVRAEDNLTVAANSSTDADAVTGLAGVGLAFGGGAGVGIVHIDKNTDALIDNNVTAIALAKNAPSNPNGTKQGVSVLATSDEDLTNVSVAGSGGFVGVAGAVNVSIVDSDTSAFIDDGALINPNTSTANAQQSVYVNASNTVNVLSGAGSASVGVVAAVAGAVDIGSIRNDTAAFIGANAQIDAKNDIEVTADESTSVRSLSASGQLNLVGGLSGSVSVWNIGTKFDPTYNDSADPNSAGVTRNALQGESSSNIESNRFADKHATKQIELARLRVLDGLNGFQQANANDPTMTTMERLSSFADDERFTVNNINANENLLNNALNSEEQNQATLTNGVVPGTSAEVRQGAILRAGDDVEVSAENSYDLHNFAGGVSVSLVGALGAAVNVVKVGSKTTTKVAGTIAAGDDITILAKHTAGSQANPILVHSLAGQGAIGLALGASINQLVENSTQSTTLSSTGSILEGDNVLIRAESDRFLKAESGQLTLAVVASGASFDRLFANGSTTVQVLGDIGQDPGSEVNHVTIEANSEVSASAKAKALGFGIISGQFNFTRVDATPIVRTQVDGSDITVQGDLNVLANTDYVLSARTDGFDVSAGDISISKATAVINAAPSNTINVLANVDDATINANNVHVQAKGIGSTNAQAFSSKGDLIGGLGATSNSSVAQVVEGSVTGTPSSVLLIDPTFGTAGTVINANQDVKVSGISQSSANATTNSKLVDLFGIALVHANAKVDSTTDGAVDGNVQIQAGRDLTVESASAQIAIADAEATAISLTPDPLATANAVVLLDTTVTIGEEADLEAGNQLKISARTEKQPSEPLFPFPLPILDNGAGPDTFALARADTFGAGLGGNGTATANASIGNFSSLNDGTTAPRETVTVNIERDTDLHGKTVLIESLVNEARTEALANAFSGGVIVSQDAIARARMSLQTQVNIGSGLPFNQPQIIGDQSVAITSKLVDTSSIADALSNDFGGSVGTLAKAVNAFLTDATIDTADSTKITTRDLTVTTEAIRTEALIRARKDGLFGLVEDVEIGATSADRIVDWNADVFILGAINPELIIDANGNVIKADNVQIFDLDNTTLGPVQSDTITVAPINHLASAQPIRFSANSFVFDPPVGASFLQEPSQITGTLGTVTYRHTLDGITIRNDSTKDLVVQSIDVVSEVVPRILIDFNEVDLEFGVVHEYKPTAITIENTTTAGTPDIHLSGLMNNPIGSVLVRNSAGDILGSRSHTLQTSQLTLVAPNGNLGDAVTPLRVELVQSPQANAGISINSAGNTNLDLLARLRQVLPNNQAFVVPFQSVSVAGNFNLNLRGAVKETVINANFPLSEVEEVKVLEPSNDVTLVQTHFRPFVGEILPPLPFGIFGENGVPAPLTLQFSNVQVAGDINITDTQSADITLTGTLQVFGAGDIQLNSMNGSNLNLLGGNGSNHFRLQDFGGSVRINGQADTDLLSLTSVSGLIETVDRLTLDGTVTTTSAAATTLRGSLNLTSTITINVANSASFDDLIVDADITGSAGFSKIGTGTMRLDRASTSYTGTMTVRSGRLTVNNNFLNSPVVLGGGTLEGVGQVGNVSNQTGANSILNPGISSSTTGVLSTGNLILNSTTTYAVQINGTTQGSGYSAVRATGTVQLNNAILQPTIGFSSAVGNSYVIIDNDGTDAVVGTFVDLPEGATIVVNNITLQITYRGGTGNDVVLTHINTPSRLPGRAITAEIDENGIAVLTGDISDPDPLDTFTLRVDWGDGQVEIFTFDPEVDKLRLEHRYLDNPVHGKHFNVHLDWCDPHGGGNTDTLKIRVNNLAPEVAIAGPPIGVVGQALSFQFLADDPSPVDDQSPFRFQIDWGDGSKDKRIGSREQILNHTYQKAGTFTIRVRAGDKDNMVSEWTEYQITIHSTATQPGRLGFARLSNEDGNDNLVAGKGQDILIDEHAPEQPDDWLALHGVQLESKPASRTKQENPAHRSGTWSNSLKSPTFVDSDTFQEDSRDLLIQDLLDGTLPMINNRILQ